MFFELYYLITKSIEQSITFVICYTHTLKNNKLVGGSVSNRSHKQEQQTQITKISRYKCFHTSVCPSCVPGRK